MDLVEFVINITNENNNYYTEHFLISNQSSPYFYRKLEHRLTAEFSVVDPGGEQQVSLMELFTDDNCSLRLSTSL